LLSVIATFAVLGTSRDVCLERYVHRAPASARAYFHAFDSEFTRVGEHRGVEPALLKAIAWCETRLDPCAVSPAGARGLMQFMPATFDLVSEAAAVDDPFDPVHAIECAGVYVAALVNYWKGSLEAVVASYNAGPGAVAKALKRGRRVPAIAETEGYVVCVLGTLARFRPSAPQVVAEKSLFTDVINLFGSEPQ
jgi:soluble lytic murein transglycosylase-like protein